MVGCIPVSIDLFVSQLLVGVVVSARPRVGAAAFSAW